MIGTIVDRDTGRAAHDEISSYDAYTRYEVRDGKLYVSAPAGLLPEQRELIIANRDALILYLTTPPAITGECRRGHQVEWWCSEYGVWLCTCYIAYQSGQPVSVQ